MMSEAFGQQANRIRSKLNKVSQICRGLRKDLATIKTETQRARLKADHHTKIFMQILEEKVRTETKDRTRRRQSECDKENNLNILNKANDLENIEIKILTSNNTKLKEKSVALANDIRLQLQELKLMEQRQQLISKKNQRLANYYSENKRQLGLRKSVI